MSGKSDLQKMPLISLLTSIRGALIGHREAAEDVVKFNQRLFELFEEVVRRAEQEDADGDQEQAEPKPDIATQAAAIEAARVIQAMRREGLTFDQVASELNSRQRLTPSGKRWTGGIVFYYLKKFGDAQ